MQDFLVGISQKSIILLIIALIGVNFLSAIDQIISVKIEKRFVKQTSLIKKILDPFTEFFESLRKSSSSHVSQGFWFRVSPALYLLITLAIFAVLPFSDELLILNTPYNLYVLLLLLLLHCVLLITTSISSHSSPQILLATQSAKHTIFYLATLFFAFLNVSTFSSSANLATIVFKQEDVYFAIPLLPVFILTILVSVFIVKELYYNNMKAIGEEAGYSGIKSWAMQVSRYLYIFSLGGIITSLFLGGYIEAINTTTQIILFIVKSLFISSILILGTKIFLVKKLEKTVDIVFRFALPIMVIWLLIISFAIFYR